MVLLRIKPNQMLRLLNLTGNFTSTWPGSQKAGRFEMVLRDVGWILGMLNAFLILLALFYADYYYINGKDVVTLMKPLCETATLIDVILALILCRFKRTSLQVTESLFVIFRYYLCYFIECIILEIIG